MQLPRFFHPHNAPIYIPAILSLAGTLFYMVAERDVINFTDRWSPHYLLATPFIHGGPAHFLLNIMALHFIGGQMLLPRIGARHFVFLLAAGAMAGSIANNLMGASPAIGFSTAVMAVIAATLYPYGKAGMKLLFIHDLLGLPPLQFRHIAAFIVMLDIAGILLGWQFFAHWAHLGGFAAGIVYGYFRFGAPK